MIKQILPPQVAAVETFEDLPDARLFPAEEALLSNSVDKRRREFTTARWCARQALAALHIPPGPIPSGERGAPQWPDHIVGSITHCDDYRAAAVARRAEMLTIGIDAEPNRPLPDGVYDAIALDPELRRGDALSRASPEVHWDRLLFSAKETVYKAWFPLTRRRLDFEEADIVLHPDGTFTARLLTIAPAIPGTGFTGRWLDGNGLLVTAIAVTRR